MRINKYLAECGIASGAVGGAATSLFGGAAVLLCLIPIGICLFMLSFTRQ